MRQLEQAAFLVVDDFDSMRRITINQLRTLGAKRVFEAPNGADALRILRAEHIDVVISDWNMPVMTGLELLLAVRGDPKTARLPFIMITADAERDRVQLAIDAGVNELLVKPYSAALFSERLERAFTRRPPRPAAARTATAAPTAAPAAAVPVPVAATEPARPTILVVDDTPDNLHLLSRMFKDEYRVKIAHNGEKALAICHTDTPPDLVLLDVMMPGIDGFEVAAQLRSHPSSEHIPIIFVTALTDDASRLRGMELGAVDFVTKPIDPDALRLRVRNFMRYVGLHRELQANYDTMLETARLKEEVEHITRHDMKGALAAVIGLVQGLADGAQLPPGQLEQLLLAEQAALQALDMVNLSAEIYKIETGSFTLRPQPVPVAQILGRLATLAGTTYRANNVAVHVTVPAGVPPAALTAVGDPMLCYSLFQNLIKNACEAAPPGTAVTVTVAGGERIAVAIANQGVVPPAIRERFFEKFVTSGKPGGTGLGTYSARLLAEAQGGAIAMQTSDADQATTVTVALPSHAL
ncbi:response regulator [Duganella sp. FT92W]|uniref:histidine kinase n=2 Tax=Pseudoduganella rivuli TaxID=2666085 RepID=A0A7X2II82_9BURK|nr:hybrid sensor histidine kinase/response regulator [Pseudoduganella rivuli]MRV70271.1 response regulator [Pseudoduganella rivuli]